MVIEEQRGMKIPEKGEAREQVLSTLESYKGGDLAWRTGRVWAYVYDPGKDAEKVAKDAYMSFLSESGLDPTTFPSVHRLETEVVRMLINLLRGDENCVGNFTSGGTESILCAVKAARDHAKSTRGIAEPEIVLPVTAHGAFHKACAYFEITPRIAAMDPETCKADLDDMRKLINKNTILLVGSAPSYGHGVVDPIPEIAALAQEHGILCHVDGCVGGIHLSFMREMGMDVPPFDFTVPGVTSISTDMHKYGYAPKGASVVMYRNKDIRFHQMFACRKTTTYALVNTTVMSTKSGGPMAGSWAMLHYMGKEGYKKIVSDVMEATRRLVDGINAIDGLRVLGDPAICMFSFTSDAFNIFELADVMRPKGWYLQPQFTVGGSPANLHITVNESSVGRVDEFLADLKVGVQECKDNPNPIDRAQVQAMVDSLGGDFSPEKLQMLAEQGGLSGTELPDQMGLINTVMDCLPDEVAEFLLINYLNDVFV